MSLSTIFSEVDKHSTFAKLLCDESKTPSHDGTFNNV